MVSGKQSFQLLNPAKLLLRYRRTLVVFIGALIVLSLCVSFTKLVCKPSPFTDQQLNLIEEYRRLNISFGTFNNLVAGNNNKVYQYNRSSPLLFISSAGKISGGAFLSDLLDSHSAINCGHERNYIAHLLMMRQRTMSTQKERNRLRLGGVVPDVFVAGTSAFILEIFTRQVQPAEYLCNEDFYTITDAYFLSDVFPQSKFLLVIRDGRAVALSKMPENRINATLFDNHLQTWNTLTNSMIASCRGVGVSNCMMLYYEHLMLYPIQYLNKILIFLNLSLQNTLYKENVEFFEKLKAAMYQAKHSSTRRELNEWVNRAPREAFVLRNTTALLAVLGYFGLGHPPNYQKLNPRTLYNSVTVPPNLFNI